MSDPPAPRRVHFLSLAPGDRFRFAPGGNVFRIELVNQTYQARDDAGQLWTVVGLLARHPQGANGLFVIPETPPSGGRP